MTPEKKKRRRTIPPAKAMAALGFYQQLPVPEKIVCAKCGEERNSIGQEEWVCLRCRWYAKKERREAAGEG